MADTGPPCAACCVIWGQADLQHGESEACQPEAAPKTTRSCICICICICFSISIRLCAACLLVRAGSEPSPHCAMQSADAAAQVCQQKPAQAFCNGMEYFNTFGGCTAAGAAGLAVLAAIREEGLQQNAQAVGAHLLAGLQALQKVRHVRKPQWRSFQS